MQSLCTSTSIFGIIDNKLLYFSLTRLEDKFPPLYSQTTIQWQVFSRCLMNVHCVNQTAVEIREEQSNDVGLLWYPAETASVAFYSK